MQERDRPGISILDTAARNKCCAKATNKRNEEISTWRARGKNNSVVEGNCHCNAPCVTKVFLERASRRRWPSIIQVDCLESWFCATLCDRGPVGWRKTKGSECRRWATGKIGAGAWQERIREWEFRALIPRYFCNSRREKGVFADDTARASENATADN